MDQFPVFMIPLSEVQLQNRFERLQRRLVPLWKSIERLNRDRQTIVVVPSMSVDFPMQGARLQAYEERFLFLLLLLRQPNARLIYVTSQEIIPGLIDYYLGLLPGIIAGQARKRLFLVSPHDGSPDPLSAKLLARPGLMRQIRSMIEDPERAHIVPFNATRLERDLCVALGVPMYACDPHHSSLGTKSGGRRLFSEAGVPHPFGFENLTSTEELVEALREIRLKRPEITGVVLKHDEGVSGLGNAHLDLENIPGQEYERALAGLKPVDPGLSSEDYLNAFVEHGGVVEERIAGGQLRSPSVQMRVTPLGSLELLSTHDQLLGGEGNQVYQGCEFPAAEEYASLIAGEGLKVGELLARKGVIGRFAVDFICRRTDHGWTAHAIELNLRKGGTTHPFLTLQFLTDGSYDNADSRFRTPAGQAKFLVASDHLESPSFRVFQPEDVFEVSVQHGLHYDHSRQTGVVFHMISALGEFGMLGLTCVENSREEARNLFDKVRAVLHSEAIRASAPHDLWASTQGKRPEPDGL